MIEADDALHARMREHLEAHPRVEVDDLDLRHAAVAVAIVGDEDRRACFLLTRRAASLRSHGGQWALPGGRVDRDESSVQAARRELHEEVGVDDVDVLGVLDDYPTRSGYRITPVVVWVEQFTIVPNPDEVAEVHFIPLEQLERDDAPRFVNLPDAIGPVIQMPIGEQFIHAPTAAVLYQVREVALRGRSTRVAHFDEPPFARR